MDENVCTVFVSQGKTHLGLILLSFVEKLSLFGGYLYIQGIERERLSSFGGYFVQVKEKYLF